MRFRHLIKRVGFNLYLFGELSGAGIFINPPIFGCLNCRQFY